MSATKAALNIAFGTAAKLLGALVCIKIMAVYLGPQGLGVLGNFMSVVSMLTILTCGAVSLGVTRYVADFQHNRNSLRSVLQVSSSLVVFSCSVLMVGVLVFAEELSLLLFNSDDYTSALRMGSLFLLPIGYASLGLAMLNGFSDTFGLAIVQVGAALFGSLGLFVGVYFWGVQGAVLGLLWVGACVLCFVVYRLYGSKRVCGLDLLPHFDRSIIRLLLPYALMMLVTVVCQNSAQIVIRGWIQDAQGWTAVGYWQAMSRTSDAYLQIFNAFLVAYLLPQLSQQRNAAAALKLLSSMYCLVIPSLLFVLIVGFFARDIIIGMLFATSFYPMRELFLPQMIADFFKVLAFLPGYLVIARGYTPLLLAGDPVQVGLLLLISPHFIEKFGALGACVAASITYGIYLVLSMVLLMLYKKRAKNISTI
jgi:antigen flippase